MPWDTALDTVSYGTLGDTTYAGAIEQEKNDITEYYTNFLTGVFKRTRTITRIQYVGVAQDQAVAYAAWLATNPDTVTGEVTQAKASRANNANAWQVDLMYETFDTWTGA